MSDSPIHVIDDDEAARESLAFLFQSAGLAALTYAGPHDFLAVVQDRRVGCVVTDVRMPEMNGLELLQALRAQGVMAPVIIITGHGDVPMAVAAMKEGACDFFEKPFDDELLLAAVANAIASDPSETLAAGAVDGALRSRIDQLSARERQVLDGLLEGLPNKTIAYDLGISARTVEIYRAKVMTKMGASSFAELVRLAMQAGVAVGAG